MVGVPLRRGVAQHGRCEAGSGVAGGKGGTGIENAGAITTLSNAGTISGGGGGSPDAGSVGSKAYPVNWRLAGLLPLAGV